MWDSIIRHINSRIWKRFDQELFIERQVSSHTERSRTSPILQPFSCSNQFRVYLLIIESVESFQMFLDFFGPFFITISQIPLITQSDHTFILKINIKKIIFFINFTSWSRNYQTFRFKVSLSFSRFDHIFSIFLLFNL